MADYKTWLHDAAQKLPEEEVAECRCLEVEYFIMRTAMVRNPHREYSLGRSADATTGLD